jgi:D-alanyl-D-alanine carboxypeptidase
LYDWLPKGLTAGLLAAALLTAPLAEPSATAATSPSTAPPPIASAAILVDADTGRVIFEQNAHTPLPPGSLTKTLTAMIAAGWLSPGTEVPVAADAFNASPDKVGMATGQKWPLDIALHALITDSANDAAYALADLIGGSLHEFPKVMQNAGDEIGLTDHPTLEDPAGLDGTEGVRGGNRISAWDLAIMGRDMMANPVLAAIADEQTYDFEGPDHIAYHIVSRNLHFLRSYPGAIGVKTGYTVPAGFCSMEEAERGGRHMLAVILHSNNPDQFASNLITQGFATPVTAETNHPELPAIVTPTPTIVSAPRTIPLDPPAQAAALVVHNHSIALDFWIDVGGIAGIIAGLGLWVRKWMRRGLTRRSHPADEPTPR